MGCGSSSDVAQSPAPAVDNNGTTATKQSKKEDVRKPPVVEVQKKIAEPPLAFEVDITDIKLPRKLPPLRFKKDDKTLPQNDVTLEKLQKRQADAEERRKKILDQRVKSARHFQGRQQPHQENVSS